MKKFYKFLILFLSIGLLITIPKTNAAVGYTYSHSGEPIYSTVGLASSTSGIYTVISDQWTNQSGEALLASEFTSPEDLFLYTEDGGSDIIYIADSASNNLFVFDEDMRYQYKVTQYEIRPEDFTDEEILKVKTAFTDNNKNTTSISFTDYLQKKSMNLADFRSMAEIPYAMRTEAQKFYLNCFGLSGVYRNVRPAKNPDGTIIRGVYQDLIYLSDKNNNQIILVDADDYHVVQVVTSPTDISFSGKVFMPVKLVTDVAGRMFVISEGVYEGIMQMSYEGQFSSYVGVNYVSMTFWQLFWRKFMTDEQLAQTETILNTIFTSLTIDDEGFIYATSRAVNDTDDTTMIKRINPSGKDVLTRNGYSVPKGDLVYIKTGTDVSVRGPSRFSAVAVNDYGVYTLADGKTGRLFTYDDEGNLLYISGGSGNELSDLNNPVAIRYQGDNILALDKENQSVLRFEPTDIANSINKAVKYHYEGNLVASSEEWKNVVSQNPNYEYAYVGIGKSLLNEGRYVEAMSYFQTGFSVGYYSKAYKLYRDEQINQYFTGVMSVVLIAIAAGVGYKIYHSIKYKKPEETGMGDE
ncbi:MAG TPA: hypothetical protein DD618_04315 [Acholeplasmatales bacterium]|nr:hypothetical protein [Acholeplasmatales bacterium]